MCEDFMIYSDEFDEDAISIIGRHFTEFGDLAYDFGFLLHNKYECNRSTSAYLTSSRENCNLENVVKAIHSLLERKREEDEEAKKSSMPNSRMVPYVRMMADKMEKAEKEAAESKRRLEDLQESMRKMLLDTDKLKNMDAKKDIININNNIGHQSSGKTSFINTLPSLLKHTSYDSVVSRKLTILEDMRVNHVDEDMTSTEYHLKHDPQTRNLNNSEITVDLGFPSYILNFDNHRYRIIECPSSNLENETIFNCFAKLNKIHAILAYCSDEERSSLSTVNTFLQHVAPQLPCHNNMVFVFNRHSGESFTANMVGRFNRDLAQYDTKLNRSNTFCWNNYWFHNAILDVINVHNDRSTRSVNRDQFLQNKEEVIRLFKAVRTMTPINTCDGVVSKEN